MKTSRKEIIEFISSNSFCMKRNNVGYEIFEEEKCQELMLYLIRISSEVEAPLFFSFYYTKSAN